MDEYRYKRLMMPQHRGLLNLNGKVVEVFCEFCALEAVIEEENV